MARERIGPYIETLKDTDDQGRSRIAYWPYFRNSLITDTLLELRGLLERRVQSPYYSQLYTLMSEIEEVVGGGYIPSDQILSEWVFHTDLEYWSSHHARWFPNAYPNRILIDAHVTSAGNLSVRFSPECLGGTGEWEPAPEWKTIPFLGNAEIMQRPNDEVLFIRDVQWLISDINLGRDDATIRGAASKAVNMAFWLVVSRLSKTFEVHLGRYVVHLSSSPRSSDSLGLGIADALADQRRGLAAAVKNFSNLTGHSAQHFWDVCQDMPLRNGKASRQLRGKTGPSSRLTPSVIGYYHGLLKQAVRYGLWKPGVKKEQLEPVTPRTAPAYSRSQQEKATPVRPRNRGIQTEPVQPAPSQNRDPMEPPDYSMLGRYAASEAELAEAGVRSIDELVRKVNALAKAKGAFPVSQADFPTGKISFRRLLKRLAALEKDA